MAADDEADKSSPAVRVTLRDIWTKQEEMSQTLQSVAQAVAPLVGHVERLQSEKLGVSDYKYERDVRDHQQGEFRTDIETRLRVVERWVAARSGGTAAIVGVLYVAGGSVVGFILTHVFR